MTDPQEPCRKPETSVSISHKEDFRSETIEDREEHYTMIEISTFKEDTVILNVYSSNKRVARYVRQTLIGLQRRTDEPNAGGRVATSTPIYP